MGSCPTTDSFDIQSVQIKTTTLIGLMEDAGMILLTPKNPSTIALAKPETPCPRTKKNPHPTRIPLTHQAGFSAGVDTKTQGPIRDEGEVGFAGSAQPMMQATANGMQPALTDA